MNILFLSLGKYDDINQKSIYTDLLRKFNDENHKIWIVTPRESKENIQTQLVEQNGVIFLKVKTGDFKKVNIIKKGLSTVSMESTILSSIKKYLSDVKFDLVLYATPPITFYKIVKYIKERDGAKAYLMLKDIFPQNSVDLEMFGSRGLIYKYFRNKEKKLYEISDYIGCMSPANKEYVLEHNQYIDHSKVEIFPNTSEPQDLCIDSVVKKDIKYKYDIPLDKKLFIYGGNLGKPQGIPFLIDCIIKNEDNENSFILIVGTGTEYSKLKKHFDTYKPKNAMLLDFLPKAEYELLANSADVGLIFLDYRFTIPNFPSRVLSYMQASMPIIVASDANTDIGDIAEEEGFGFKCLSNNVEAFNKCVLSYTEMKETKFLAMGNKSRQYFEENYTTNHSYEIIMQHFKD